MEVITRKKVVEENVYIASDGMEFDTELRCKEHEIELINRKLYKTAEQRVAEITVDEKIDLVFTPYDDGCRRVSVVRLMKDEDFDAIKSVVEQNRCGYWGEFYGERPTSYPATYVLCEDDGWCDLVPLSQIEWNCKVLMEKIEKIRKMFTSNV